MDYEYFKNIRDIDNLTDIFRRDVVLSYMDNLLTNNEPFSFLILDIDNFKTINDNYGHHVGDIVLHTVAKSLKELTMGKGVVGRYGGDEFIFVFPNITEYQDIWQICFDILKSTKTLKIPEYDDMQITYTIGVSRFPLNSNNIDELLILADKALYRGKIKGRNCFIIYLPEKHADIKLEATRDKVYTPMFLHAKLYNLLTRNDNYQKNIQDVINFLGSYLLIDNVCIETDKNLLFQYTHPLIKKKKLLRYGFETIDQCTSSNGIFIENTTFSSKIKDSNPLLKKMVEQEIYSSVICVISAFGYTYGYLRAEVISLDTGRIWQNDDLVTLICVCNYIALMLYSLNVKELN
ncbi:MAG: GGDEF domain-containing protein [Acholeplasmatales bacterium]|nr:GGDEF domain-containing protein [Acholeplasmatales bacterium]